MLAILPMQANQRSAFAEIWIPWLRDTMKRTPETEDLAIMADPATYYREHGGEVFLAMLDGLVVGAVAVKKLGDTGFEFCKLVVAQQARGHGAGRALVERCIAFAAEQGGPALVWVRAQQLDYFRARGLMPPGSYSHNENQKPATIAVNKAGQGVGDQKQTASKTAKKSTQHVRSAKKNSSTFGYTSSELTEKLHRSFMN